MSEFPDVEKTDIDLEAIQEFESEEDFVGLAVSLLIETGSHVCIVGNIFPYDTKAWDSDQAILGGHFVRLYKLISAMLDQTCQHRREISFMIARMAFECIINTSYLINNYSPELALSYKSYSLKHEKKLMNRISDNIKKRNGKVLPIENRMLKSIRHSFKVSGVEPEQINPKELRNWGNKNIYEKSVDVGLGEAYLAAFGGPSHGIHGNWQDLLEYHLDSNEQGQFTPVFEWHRPRPQYLNVIAIQAAELSKQYIAWLEFNELEHLVDALTELQGRISAFDSAHEQWVSKQTE